MQYNKVPPRKAILLSNIEQFRPKYNNTPKDVPEKQVYDQISSAVHAFQITYSARHCSEENLQRRQQSLNINTMLEVFDGNFRLAARVQSSAACTLLLSVTYVVANNRSCCNRVIGRNRSKYRWGVTNRDGTPPLFRQKNQGGYPPFCRLSYELKKIHIMADNGQKIV